MSESDHRREVRRRTVGAPRRGSASPPGPRPLLGRREPAAAGAMPWSCARRMRMPRIRAIDTAAARKAPGVLAVLTGADLAADGLGNLPTDESRKRRDGVAGVHDAASGAGPRTGSATSAIRSRSWSRRRRSRPSTPRRSSRVDYEPLPAVARDGRCQAPGRAGGVGRGARQHRLRLGGRHHARPSTAAFAAAAHVDPARLRGHPRGRRADRAARRRRRVRPAHRPLHAAHRHPGARTACAPSSPSRSSRCRRATCAWSRARSAAASA